MKNKNKFALLIALTAFQFFYFGGAVEGAEIDNELAIIAAEQDNSSGAFLNPSQNSPSQENFSGDDKKKIAEENQPEVFQATQTEKNSQPVEEKAQPVEETITVIEEQVNQPTDTKTATVEEKVTPPAENVSQPVTENVAKPAETSKPVAENISTPAENSLQSVNLQSPTTNYANFEDLAAALKFTPLYIPKKSGYTVNEIFSIANQTAEIRYGRRWEPEVSLIIRTYKRKDGEELKDISGIQGVKWRIDMTSGTRVYIAKINERSHVASWASGSYTFAAYVENLSFAAFHSLVIDELVDLTTHYYTNF